MCFFFLFSRWQRSEFRMWWLLLLALAPIIQIYLIIIMTYECIEKKNKNALTATSCSHIERGAPLNCNKINLNEQKFVSYSYSYVYILTLIVCLWCTFSTYELSCNDMKTRKNNPVIITIHFVAFVRKRKKQFVLEQVHFTYIHTTLERNT